MGIARVLDGNGDMATTVGSARLLRIASAYVTMPACVTRTSPSHSALCAHTMRSHFLRFRVGNRYSVLHVAGTFFQHGAICCAWARAAAGKLGKPVGGWKWVAKVCLVLVLVRADIRHVCGCSNSPRLTSTVPTLVIALQPQVSTAPDSRVRCHLVVIWL